MRIPQLVAHHRLWGANLKISVVTTSYNSGDFIGEAIQSALDQAGGVAFEHIVADAESSDGTAQVLASFPHLKVDCRSDRGIYDGMNRAISMATGEVICILNADDKLLPGALLEAARLMADDSIDVATGAFQLMQEDGVPERQVYAPAHAPSYRGLLFGVPAINARFFRRNVFDRVGPFDLDFPLAADRVWLLRAVAAGVRFSQTSAPIYAYRQHAGSATLAGNKGTSEKLWLSHIDMVDRLMPEAAGNRDLAQALQSLRTLELMKLRLRRAGGGAALAPGQSRMAAIGDLVYGCATQPAGLAGALATWRKLRGQHSEAHSG